ncbi:MAG: hypothetical protein ABW104_04195 [Candidatus Thiodiazotropha sp. 6PLUC2]
MDNSYISAINAVGPSYLKSSSNHVEIGYGASLNDISNFENSMKSVKTEHLEATRSEGPSVTEKAVTKPLDFINKEAEAIANYAKSAIESGNELTPSEIVMLTARSHEFMFHCQLTSNIANRTSDGLQQLFRQQS